MSMTEPGEQTALPLAEAAARLGIAPDTLRMRMRRGKADGFKRDGHLFVYLPAETPGEPRRPAAGASERRANRAHRARGAEPRPPAGDPLSVVVEFQKIELDRLLKESVRLNERLDQQLDEVRQLRQMLQREQVLRQQEHNLRQHLQLILDRLTERLALPPPSAEAAAEPGAAAPERPAAQARTPGQATEAAIEPAVPEDRGPEWRAGREDEAALEPEPAPAPEAAPGPATEPASGVGAATGPETAAETMRLAEMLKEIGQSLRDIETPGPDAAVRGPAQPAPGGQDFGEDEDDLGPVDPWDRDRRNAARMMKKLLRTRQTPRPRDT